MKKYIALFLALVMIFALCACGGKTDTPKTDTPKTDAPKADTPKANTPKTDTPATTPEPPKENEQITLRIGIDGFVGDLNMAGAEQECRSATFGVFDLLFFPDPKTREWTSNVLTEWHREEDDKGKWMVLTMRDDIYFSNGDHATSEDLLYSYTSFVDRDMAGWLNEAKVIPGDSYIRDEYTIALKVDDFVEGFYNRVFPLQDKKWCVEANWDAEKWYYPVGSGPYYVADHKPNESYVLKLRDDYWLRPASDFYINEYIITKYADTATAYMALEIGDIDICRVAKTEFTRLQQDGPAAGLGNTLIPTGVTTNLYMPGHLEPAWQNKLVREAVAVGVNWEELDQLVYGSLYKVAKSITPSDSPVFYDAGGYEFNPERAKELLAEAGYQPGELLLKTCLFESEPYKTWGQGFAYYLSEIGIETDITYADNVTVFAWWASGDTAFSMHDNIGGSPSRNPISSINIALGTGAPYGLIEDEHFQELYKKLDSMFEAPLAERKPVAEELQKYIHDEILIIPMHEDVVAYGFNEKILSADLLGGYIFGAGDIRTDRLGLRENWG